MIVSASRSTGLGAGALFYAQSTGRFLMGLRSPKGGDAGNTWCCFGGGVEDGETYKEAVFRELREEAGVTVECPLFLIYTCRDDPTFTYINYVGIVPEEFDCTLNSEHKDYRWFSANNFPPRLHTKFRKALACRTAQSLLTSFKHV